MPSRLSSACIGLVGAETVQRSANGCPFPGRECRIKECFSTQTSRHAGRTDGCGFASQAFPENAWNKSMQSTEVRCFGIKVTDCGIGPCMLAEQGSGVSTCP